MSYGAKKNRVSMISISRIRGRVLCLYGPTASNKSLIALKIAQYLPVVIINADSMQVYKDIGMLTAQPNFNIISKISLF